MGEEGYYIPKRYILAALGFMGIFNVVAMRTSLGIAIVAMVNSTTKAFSNSTDFSNECPSLTPKTEEIEVRKVVGMQFNWSAQEQSLILGAFYIGYFLSQVPGGYLSEKFGAKWLFGGAILNTAIFTLLSPLIISWSVNAFIIVRVFEGLVEGVTLPAMNFIVSQWSPITERSRLSTLIFSGYPLGIVFSMIITGWLCSSSALGGWPSAFYILGSMSCVWFLFWAFLSHESPSVHPTISLQELQLTQDNSHKEHQKRPETPWKDIFSSLPMWAAIVTHVGQGLGLFTFLSELPTYLDSVLHFDIKKNGLLSSIIFAAQAIVGWIASYIADKLRESNTISITNIRKIFNTLGIIGPAVCLLVITVSGCRPHLIVFLFAIGMAFNGCIFAGLQVIHIDMNPNFAGTLYAIGNTGAVFCGFIGPYIAGAFINSGSYLQVKNQNLIIYKLTRKFRVTSEQIKKFGIPHTETSLDKGSQCSDRIIKVRKN